MEAYVRRALIAAAVFAVGCVCAAPCPSPVTEIIHVTESRSDAGPQSCEDVCREGASAFVVRTIHACRFLATDAGAAVECTYDQICGG